MKFSASTNRLTIGDQSECLAGRIMQRFRDTVPSQQMQHFPFAYTVIDDVLPDDIFRRAHDSLPSFVTGSFCKYFTCGGCIISTGASIAAGNVPLSLSDIILKILKRLNTCFPNG